MILQPKCLLTSLKYLDHKQDLTCLLKKLSHVLKQACDFMDLPDFDRSFAVFWFVLDCSLERCEQGWEYYETKLFDYLGWGGMMAALL